ncbi:geranylgeranyl pyrophosphate synthase [Cladochytrium replicatum]|nr:geranylgeranyl pyrophosphate synthase [Cladochytrium replicatum]
MADRDLTDKILLEPYHYLAANPGKDFRSKLIQAFNLWLNVPKQKLDVICDVVQMLHTASLLIDDIEDNSSLRRGSPVAHKIYGTAITINCGNYVFFLALQKLLELNDDRVVDIFTSEMINLHRGQGQDIYWRDSYICPTEEQYLSMVNDKTGGLLRLAVKLMQVCSPDCSTDFVPLVNLLGMHFQVRDDYVNLTSAKFSDNKGYAEDLTEGKFSFVITHCIRTDTSNHAMLNILKQRPTDLDVKKYAIQLMQKTRSFEYTLEFLRRIEAEARATIAGFGGNKVLEGILDFLNDNMVA